MFIFLVMLPFFVLLGSLDLSPSSLVSFAWISSMRLVLTLSWLMALTPSLGWNGLVRPIMDQNGAIYYLAGGRGRLLGSLESLGDLLL
jgi:hypothetical protein